MKTVLGYASLLSPVSIRRLFPNAQNLTPVEISGHARCFNSYGTLSIAKGLAGKGETYLAHASAIRRPDATLYALAFDLDAVDFKTYQRHEFRYDLQEVRAVSRETGEAINAIICYESCDHLIDTSLVGVKDIYALYAQYGVNAFWHRAERPAKIYLKHCLAAARDLGADYVANFLDTTYIHDRETSLREYLAGEVGDIEAYIAAAELSGVF